MSTRIGKIAEHEFELMCLKREIPIYSPIVDVYGVDFIIQARSKLYKIQVKSTLTKDPSKNSYKINVNHGFDSRKYKDGTFDFLVVFLFDLSLWYIIPDAELKVRTIRINPLSDKGKYSQYKERWDLLK